MQNGTWGRRGFLGGLGAGTASLIAAGVATAPSAAAYPVGASPASTWSVVHVDISLGTTEATIQNALNAVGMAGGGHVIVGPGLWTIGKYLSIYSNTRLTLSPWTCFQRVGDVRFMLVNGLKRGDKNFDGGNDDAITGYNGRGGIIVEGGIWDVNGPLAEEADLTAGYNGLQFVHAKNITVRDLEIRNVTNWHAIKLQGVSNATVENCRFIGYQTGTNRRKVSEAVCIDSCWPGNTLVGQEDHTTCADIRIIGNYCDAGKDGKNYPVFAGCHSAEPGHSHERVEISGNSIGNATQFGIWVGNINQVIVSNNRIHDSFGGIRVGRDYSLKNNPLPAWDFIVSDNIVTDTTSDRGIEVWGAKFDDPTAPVLAEARRSVVSGNLVRAAKREGIHVAFAPDALISGNLVSDITPAGDPNGEVIVGSGISVQESPGANVTGNTVRNCSGYGVVFYGASPNGMITSNSISGAKLGPIRIDSASTNVMNQVNQIF